MGCWGGFRHMSKPLVARPPIGFIVEGQGEYDCYPSFVQQIAHAKER
jgi:hypothetical protein